MNNLMDWNKCRREFIKEVEADNERIKSIIEAAMQRKEIVKKIALNKKNVSFIIEGYYEVIKELLVAYLLKNGMRSRNHRCLMSFLEKTHPELENEIMLISKMSYYRNRLNYYGDKVPITFYEDNKEAIDKIILILLDLIKTL